jgi:succinoglycan biosynthesis transport protein ExoP
LEAQSGELETRISELEPEILRLQGDLQRFTTEEERLQRAQDVAQDTYITLARKVDEARIAAQDESGEVRLVSYAAVPTNPVSPNKKLNTAVAGALGLFVGVFGAFAVEYWRQERPVTQPPEGE